MPNTIIYALALITILFLLLEVRSLLKKREWKELIVATVILTFALIYGADYAMEWKLLPNPNRLLKVVEPASEAFNSFFEIPG